MSRGLLEDYCKALSPRLTSGTGICRSSLDSGPMPALDGVQDAFFLLALGGETCHFLAGDDGLSSSRVNGVGEDGTAVAARMAIGYWVIQRQG